MGWPYNPEARCGNGSACATPERLEALAIPQGPAPAVLTNHKRGTRGTVHGSMEDGTAAVSKDKLSPFRASPGTEHRIAHMSTFSRSASFAPLGLLIGPGHTDATLRLTIRLRSIRGLAVV